MARKTFTVKHETGEHQVWMITGHKPRYEVRCGAEVVHVEKASRAWRQELLAAIAIAEAKQRERLVAPVKMPAKLRLRFAEIAEVADLARFKAAVKRCGGRVVTARVEAGERGFLVVRVDDARGFERALRADADGQDVEAVQEVA